MNAHFRLFNSKGAQVFDQQIVTIQASQALDLGHLPSGLYVWEVVVLGQIVERGKVLVE